MDFLPLRPRSCRTPRTQVGKHDKPIHKLTSFQKENKSLQDFELFTLDHFLFEKYELMDILECDS